MPTIHQDNVNTRPNWGLAAVIIGLTMLASCSNSMFPVLGPRIMEMYELSAEQFGKTMGLRNLFRIPSLLLVGPLIGVFGPRRVAEFAMIGVAIAFLILGVGQAMLAIQVSLALFGFFNGLFSVAVPTLLISLVPARKRGMFSVNLVAIAFPAMIYPFLARELLTRTENQPEYSQTIFAPFAIFGGLLLVGAIVLSFWKREKNIIKKQPPEASTGASPARQNPLTEALQNVLPTLCSIQSILVILLICLHASADNTVYTFLPTFMENQFENLYTRWTAWAVSVHALAYVLTRSVLAVLPEGLGQRLILTLAGPLGGSLVVGMLWSGSPMAIVLLYLLASMMFAAEFPTLTSEVSSRSMGGFGTVIAAGLLLSEVATFAMLTSTGMLADNTGDYRVALSFAACGFITFGIIAFVMGLGHQAAKDRD